MVLAGVLAACAPQGGDDAKATAGTSAPAAPAVRSGGSLGAKGSACELPVAFDIAEKWSAEAVDAPLHQGPVTLACEIDAKPAGSIGFLRVWTGRPGDDSARSVLEAFLAAEDGVSKERYRAFTTGGLSGTEVEYLARNEMLDETKQERALAVTTPQGPVVLHLGGLDIGEHRSMVPAYELARQTLHTG